MLDSPAPWSLRRRVELISALAMCVALLVGGIAMYMVARMDDERRLDEYLQHLAVTLQGFAEDELAEMKWQSSSELLHTVALPTTSPSIRYMVWSRAGTLLICSHESRSQRPMLDLAHRGYRTVVLGNDAYRVFALSDARRDYVLHVAEKIDDESASFARVTAYYMGFLLLPFGLALGTTRLLLRRSFRSLEMLADHLRQGNPLDATLPRVPDPPTELRPVLSSLDVLFSRIRHAISVERGFTSVAAHELRTPLAGVRAQAQLAKMADTPGEQQEALTSLIGGVDRASRLIDQMLDLARLDSMDPGVLVNHREVDLISMYQDLVDVLGPKANAKRLALSARFRVDRLQGLDFAIHVLLRNLLANAILYTPQFGRIEVRSEREGSSVILTVDDSGPGIPARDREQAFERFNRLGQSQSEGAGLGLSIVAQVIDLHRARIQLQDSALGGLRVRMAFPQPGAARDPPN